MSTDIGAALGSFVLCDSNSNGFPIRFASQGFCEMFGYSVSECLGRKCGSLVGGPSILQHQDALGSVSKSPDLTPERIVECLGPLTKRTAEEIKKTMFGQQAAAHMLVLNRRNTGELLTCELIVLTLKHPTIGWSCCLGLQRDISHEVSVPQLVDSVLEGTYDTLIASQQGAMQERMRVLDLEGTKQFLYDRAAEMWHALMSEMLRPPSDTKRLKQVRSSSPSGLSLASRSTCSKVSSCSVATASSAASAATASSTRTAQSAAEDEASVGQPQADTSVAEKEPKDASRFFDLLEGSDALPGVPESDEEPLSETEADREEVLETLANSEELKELPFPLCVIDTSGATRPIVACSAGFSSCTEYEADDVIGQDANVMVRGVPSVLVDAEARARSEELLAAAAKGKYLPGHASGIQCIPNVVEGELLCRQTQAKRSGHLFESLVLFKQVELEEAMFVLAFQVPVPLSSTSTGAVKDDTYQKLYMDLCECVDAAEKVLAKEFWYTAPMRRQIAMSASVPEIPMEA